MARYTLKKHAAADTIKWVIIFLLMIGVIGAVVSNRRGGNVVRYA